MVLLCKVHYRLSAQPCCMQNVWCGLYISNGYIPKVFFSLSREIHIVVLKYMLGLGKPPVFLLCNHLLKTGFLLLARQRQGREDEEDVPEGGEHN